MIGVLIVGKLNAGIGVVEVEVEVEGSNSRIGFGVLLGTDEFGSAVLNSH